MKNYIFSIITAAIVCGIVKGFLSEKTTIGRIGGMLCGIYMVITIIAPLKDISFSGIGSYLNGLTTDADAYVQEGKHAAEIQMRDIIKTQTEAYILDKANRMGLEISVEVELDVNNSSVPCGTVVNGAISPYAKEVLSSYIEDNLGISKEKQRWNSKK